MRAEHFAYAQTGQMREELMQAPAWTKGLEQRPKSPDNVPRVLRTTPKFVDNDSLAQKQWQGRHHDARAMDGMPVADPESFDLGAVRQSFPSEYPPERAVNQQAHSNMPAAADLSAIPRAPPGANQSLHATPPPEQRTSARTTAGVQSQAQDHHQSNVQAGPVPMPNYVKIDESGTHKEQLQEGNIVRPHLDATTVLARNASAGGFTIEADIVELGWEKKSLEVV